MDTLTKEKNTVMNCGRYPSRDMQTREQKAQSDNQKHCTAGSATDKECVQKTAKTIDIVFDSDDIETKRIGEKANRN